MSKQHASQSSAITIHRKFSTKSWLTPFAVALACLFVLVTAVPSEAALGLYWSSTVNPGGAERGEIGDLANTAETIVDNGDDVMLGIAVDRAAGDVYLANQNGTIQRMNADGTGTATDLVTGLDRPFGIDLDLPAGKMYYTDREANKIWRADLNGSNAETLVTEPGSSSPDLGINHIALDPSGGKMYWTDQSDSGVYRANLDGTSVVQMFSGVNETRGIALDLNNDKVYFTQKGGNTSILRGDLDGTDLETLVNNGGVRPGGIDLDPGGGFMYWTDDSGHKIYRAGLDGSDITAVLDRDGEANTHFSDVFVAIPEPASLTLLGVGALMVVARRKG